MDTSQQQAYRDKLQAKIDEWNAQLEGLSADVRTERNDEIEELEDLRDDFEMRIREMFDDTDEDEDEEVILEEDDEEDDLEEENVVDLGADEEDLEDEIDWEDDEEDTSTFVDSTENILEEAWNEFKIEMDELSASIDRRLADLRGQSE